MTRRGLNDFPVSVKAELHCLRFRGLNLIQNDPKTFVHQNRVPAHSSSSNFIGAVSDACECFITRALEWSEQAAMPAGNLPLAANQNRVVPGGGDFIIGIALRRKVVGRIRTAAQLDGEHRVAIADTDVIQIEVGVISSQRAVLKSEKE